MIQMVMESVTCVISNKLWYVEYRFFSIKDRIGYNHKGKHEQAYGSRLPCYRNALWSKHSSLEQPIGLSYRYFKGNF